MQSLIVCGVTEEFGIPRDPESGKRGEKARDIASR